jgi:hypothetical protein
MALVDLSAEERQVVFECLRATVSGPFFPDWEFHTLFGIERSDMKAIVDAWPAIDDSSENVSLAINNSLNNLLGYPHGHNREWLKYVSVPPEEVARIFKKWRGEPVSNSFEGLR